jgi:hypothetical protein
MTEYRIAFIDDGNRLLKTYQWSGSTWALVGTSLLLNTLFTFDLCTIGNEEIALTNESDFNLTCYSFKTNSWVQKGQSRLIDPSAGFTFKTMATVHPNRLSFLGYDSTIADYPLRVYDFNNIIFSRVGNQFIVATGTNHDSTGMDINTIAFVDDSSNEVRKYLFDGTVFAQVGTSLVISGMTKPVITALSSTRIALFDQGNAKLRTLDWNGSTFVQVGSTLTISGCTDACIDAISGSKIAFVDDSNQQLRVYSFSGSAWSLVGTSLSISATLPKFTAFFKPLPLECYNEQPLDGNAIWPISDY